MGNQAAAPCGGKGRDMSENNGRRVRRSFGGKGLAIALALGVTALAVAGYGRLIPRAAAPEAESSVTAQPAEAASRPQTSVTPQQPVREEPAQTPAEPAAPVQSIVELPLYEEIFEDEPAQETVAPEPPQLIVAPVLGETVAAFSVNELRYNETLGDWRTHDGVDIAAAEGEGVVAACSGTVVSVTDDDLMGTTVVLEHDDGYQTTYANLRSDPPVAQGQYVSAGQLIGAVGSTALIESAEGPHLHFSVTRDGDAVNPEEFLSTP